MKKYVFCFGKSLKITIRLILTLCVVFNSLCFSGCFKVVSTSPYPLYSVVIDAGHGGIDAGVLGVATGVKESDINLAIARLLAISFENAGFKVTLTRNSEAGLYGTIKKVNENATEKLLDDNGDYTEYGEYVIEQMGSSIAKYAFLKALVGNNIKTKILPNGEITYDVILPNEQRPWERR